MGMDAMGGTLWAGGGGGGGRAGASVELELSQNAPQPTSLEIMIFKKPNPFQPPLNDKRQSTRTQPYETQPSLKLEVVQGSCAVCCSCDRNQASPSSSPVLCLKGFTGRLTVVVWP